MSPNYFNVESAGIEPGKLNPLAIEVLKEEGVDISNKSTNSVASKIEQGKLYDFVITVCDESNAERCPNFQSAKKRLHWSFEDPSGLKGSWEDRIEKTRDIREQIREKLTDWLKELKV